MTDQPHPMLPKAGDILLGRYVIEEVLGEGGFATVYRGHQLGVERTVAIKCLDPSSINKDRGAAQRITSEARVASGLEHPNTITVFDYGRTEKGILFLVMEYVDGVTLETLLERGPVQPERAAHIVRQILHSLREAHSHQIVHRDLKPSNIMVCDRAGETDVVVVLDFGIAKVLTGESPMDITRKMTGLDKIIGTPRYMSPEQIRGKQLTPASDVYSVGLIFFELLTGQPLIEHSETMVVLSKQLTQAPLELPRDGSIEPKYLTVLEQALQKEVSKRFRTVNEFLGALDVAPMYVYSPAQIQMAEAETVPLDLDNIKEMVVAQHAAKQVQERRLDPVVMPRPGVAPSAQPGNRNIVLLNILLASLLIFLGIIFGAVVLPRLLSDGQSDRIVYVTQEGVQVEPPTGAPESGRESPPVTAPLQSYQVAHTRSIVNRAQVAAMTAANPLRFTFIGSPDGVSLTLAGDTIGNQGEVIAIPPDRLPNEVEISADGYYSDWVLVAVDTPRTVVFNLRPLVAAATPNDTTSTRRTASSDRDRERSSRSRERSSRSERDREEAPEESTIGLIDLDRSQGASDGDRSSRSSASSSTSTNSTIIAPIDESRSSRSRSRQRDEEDESAASAFEPF